MAKAIRVLERLTRANARIKVGELAGWKQARQCETTRRGFLAGEVRLKECRPSLTVPLEGIQHVHMGEEWSLW